ncbi:tyrosine-type recombinase/integrase [Parafrigoribacterium mesophilum]|uniref:tyrosine-type recombinase/integrase n=1 Tax=Parafrigoribacterium mesophilum TaxID=433646 RepID=UPI0031FC7C1D
MSRPPMPRGTWGNINTKKTNNGSWRASTRFRGYDGKARAVNAFAATSNAAKQKLKLILLEKSEESQSDLSGATKLKAVAELWLEEVRGSVAPNTFDEYRRIARRKIIEDLGDLCLREVTVGTVDRFLKDHAKLTPSQVRNIKSALSQVMSLAVRHDAIRSNPVRDVARITIKHKSPRALTLDEITRLRHLVEVFRTGPRVCGPRPNSDMIDIVDLMLGTGARIGEVMALRWCDVDIDGDIPCLTISGTIVEVNGQKPYRKDSPKTEAGYRQLVLPRHTVELLRRRHATSVTEWVFPSRLGGVRPLQNVHRYWRGVIKGTEFEWVNLHVLRKTVATLISATLGDDKAAKQLGHTSPDITRRYYIHRPDRVPDLTVILNTVIADDSKAGHQSTD